MLRSLTLATLTLALTVCTSHEGPTSDSESSGTTFDLPTTGSTGPIPPPCDEEPACSPDENVESCPEQCNKCGDSYVFGPDEACDNGRKDPPYSPNLPVPDPCTETCQVPGFCGDGITQNGPETCDKLMPDPAYLPSAPGPGACSPSCATPEYCGDSIPNGPEMCDDGNQTDGDGCSVDCISERQVFVSSVFHQGDMDYSDGNPDMLLGLSLADARCNSMAEVASLSGTFKAWLSDDVTSPATPGRFETSFEGRYRLISSGSPIIATGWKDLTDGSLAHPIDADEFGISTQENVWTNTLPDGTSASNLHCSGWTKSDKTLTTLGQSSGADQAWTNASAGQLCAGINRIYCFEDV